MTGPLAVTSRRHPLAVCTLVGQLVLGVAYVAGVAEPVALDELMTGIFPMLWSAGIALAAAAGLYSMFIRDLPRGMTTELASVGTLAGLNLIYVASLSLGYPIIAVIITATAFSTFTVGFGWRAVQLVLELRRLRIAASNPVLADPPALGMPSGDAEE